MFCASVVYPFDSESFDFEYFRSRHVPMFTEFLGENCQRFEVHRGLATLVRRRHPSQVTTTHFLIQETAAARGRFRPHCRAGDR